MSTLSPTQRTLRAQRAEGRICAIAEKFNAHVGPFGIRQDLFGFIDIVVLDPQRGIIGIQSTGTEFSEHIRKVLDSDCTANVIEWLKCGGKVEVWGWSKYLVKRGGSAKIWRPRAREITLADFDDKGNA